MLFKLLAGIYLLVTAVLFGTNYESSSTVMETNIVQTENVIG